MESRGKIIAEHPVELQRSGSLAVRVSFCVPQIKSTRFTQDVRKKLLLPMVTCDIAKSFPNSDSSPGAVGFRPKLRLRVWGRPLYFIRLLRV